jgi:hypothetical protein
MTGVSETGGRRGVNIVLLVIVLVSLAIAAVMYVRAGRAEHRSRLKAQVTAAWAEDMVTQKKDLSRFLPLARESLALERAALADDRAAFAAQLFDTLFLAELSHLDFFGHGDFPAPVKQLETDMMNELADIELSLLDQQDDRALLYIMAFTESDTRDLVKDDKYRRIMLEAARMAAKKIAAGNKDFEHIGDDLASTLNSRAWDAVAAAGKAADAYAQALAEAEAAAGASPSNANIQNTLAMAQYRTDKLDPATKTIARAIDLRKDHIAATDDLAVKALIDAKAGRAADALAALKIIEDQRAKSTADAIAKKKQAPSFDKVITNLMAEAHALLK